eukprot:COSAG02_NODE_4603_length_5176_cov_2.346267_3_plen_75_part_00
MAHGHDGITKQDFIERLGKYMIDESLDLSIISRHSGEAVQMGLGKIGVPKSAMGTATVLAGEAVPPVYFSEIQH